MFGIWCTSGQSNGWSCVGFLRIKTFLKEAIEPYCVELQALLYPLFVHVYLELLCNGQTVPGLPSITVEVAKKKPVECASQEAAIDEAICHVPQMFYLTV